MVTDTSVTDTNKQLTGFKIYVGSSTSYEENEECPGGPYSTERTDGHGVEVWCNLPGQYVSIVRDYSA